MPSFDAEGARRAGYSDAEIQAFVAQHPELNPQPATAGGGVFSSPRGFFGPGVVANVQSRLTGQTPEAAYRQVAGPLSRYGLPIAASIASGGLGAIPSALAAGAASAAGEAGAQAGEGPLRPAQIGMSGAIGGAGTFGGRLLTQIPTRAVLNALEKTTENVASVVGRIVPAFRGATAKETLAKVLGGTGQQALQKEFDAVETAVIAPYATTQVTLPSLGETTVGKARVAIQQLQARTQTPEVRAAAAEAKQDFDATLQQLLSPADLRRWTAARTAYLRGQTVQRLFGAAKQTQRPTAVGRLTEPESGKLNIAQLQKLFQGAEGQLARVLTPQEMAALRTALRIDPRNPLARDVAGTYGGLGRASIHPGAGTHLRLFMGNLPSQARLTGMESQIELANRIGALGGTAATGPLRAPSNRPARRFQPQSQVVPEQ